MHEVVRGVEMFTCKDAKVYERVPERQSVRLQPVPCSCDDAMDPFQIVTVILRSA